MSEAMKQILHGNAALASKLYQILSKEDGNVFFSPFGIHIILSMIYQGAQEKTAELLSQVLGLPDPQSTAQGFKEVMDHLKSLDHITFLMANKIYAKESVDRTVNFIQEFEKIVEEKFYSEVEFADFLRVSETVEKINKWVAKRTLNNIPAIIDESLITPETALFLINAIYFKGGWDEPFNEDRTKKEIFYLDYDNTEEVEMMKGDKLCGYKYDEELKSSIISMKYKGNNMSLIIILPSEKDGIKDLEEKLANSDLTEISDGLRRHKISVSLPKFKMEQTIDLKTVLLKMGLDNIFDKENANFNNMIYLSPNENLFVENAIQKTALEMNEEGTEVAVITVVTMGIFPECSVEILYPRAPDFVVDHPAIFMLVTRQNSDVNILFYGRLSSPKL